MVHMFQKKNSSAKQCSNCKFGFFYIDEGNDYVDTGECHRYPPSIPADLIDVNSDFVKVWGTDWCGEFKKKKR